MIKTWTPGLPTSQGWYHVKFTNGSTSIVFAKYGVYPHYDISLKHFCLTDEILKGMIVGHMEIEKVED